ncbi:MAG: hypothetical protein ACKOCX_07660 [Planctomycetota bacterium]
MAFFLDCEVEGPLSVERLRAAVEAAAARHPLVCSRVAWRGGRPRWLPPDVLPVVESGGADAWRPIDLSRESGLRLVVLPLPIESGSVEPATPRHRVVMMAHHAVLDGVAGCEYLGDVWAHYAGSEPPRFSAGRSSRSKTAAGGDVGGASSPWAFAMFRPRPLAQPRSSTGGRSDPVDVASPPFRSVALDDTATGRLRALTAARGWSLNDLVVAAVMRAAGRWNERVGGRAGNVRITLPVSLRPAGSREPACNALGYAFLDRTPAQCADRTQLAAGVAAASRWIVETGAAAEFLAAVGGLARRPWLLRLVTRLPVCFSTAVVSTIGDPSRRMRAGLPKIDGCDAPGDLVIRELRGVPPLRPGTRASVGVTTYRGALSLTSLCSASADGRPSPRAAEEFLSLVAAELRASL